VAALPRLSTTTHKIRLAADKLEIEVAGASGPLTLTGAMAAIN
jgi:hypothetical protein